MTEASIQSNDRFNFDYHPLKQKVSLTEIKHEIFASKLTVAAIAICLAMLTILSLVAVPTIIQSSGSPVSGLVVFIIILAVTLAATLLSSYALKRRIRLRKFAEANEMILLSPGNTKAGDYQGVIFQSGRSRSIDEGFKMPGSQGFEIANFSYVTGSGKHSRTHTWGFIKIRLPKHLPNMVLDTRSNNLFSRFSNLPSGFQSGQKISLEGDFDSHFSLYAPQQYQADARYIFTPDVMQYFIEHLRQFDVEIIDDSLYLYCRKFSFNQPHRLREAIQIIIGLQQQLFRQGSRYTDDLASVTPQINGISLQGRRLKKSRLAQLAAIIFIILYAFVSIMAAGQQ